ncbi:hypothetical protein BGZ99_000295 [Dissophora globulifera]|uniref:GAT domain-containing protein n=1 Tax=Dissophora globulifera TaxID=979702 RepID=A0A9P6ULQ5_9FUNG|nr:hypothetical protein BGZ99_000295 [Dissophora globulifera]
MALILQDIEVANNNAQMLTEAISFANPETEAIEENALIKEFCSGCLSLHRRILEHLTGVTESAQPNSTLLEKLLACNLGLAMALRSYDQIIQQPRPSSGEQVVQTQDNNTSSTSLESTQPYQTTATSAVTENDDAEATLVNSGRRDGNRKSIVTVEEPSQGPFSDDAYRVSESLEIAAAVRKGKC